MISREQLAKFEQAIIGMMREVSDVSDTIATALDAAGITAPFPEEPPRHDHDAHRRWETITERRSARSEEAVKTFTDIVARSRIIEHALVLTLYPPSKKEALAVHAVTEELWGLLQDTATTLVDLIGLRNPRVASNWAKVELDLRPERTPQSDKDYDTASAAMKEVEGRLFSRVRESLTTSVYDIFAANLDAIDDIEEPLSWKQRVLAMKREFLLLNDDEANDALTVKLRHKVIGLPEGTSLTLTSADLAEGRTAMVLHGHDGRPIAAVLSISDLERS